MSGQNTDQSQSTAEGKPQGTPGSSDGGAPQENETVDFEKKYNDLLVESRKWEQRAKADKDDAAAWRAHQESGKDDAQKLTDAQKAAESARRELFIERAARKHGVPDDYLDLIQGADEESIFAAAERVGKLASSQKPDDDGDGEPKSNVTFADPGQSGNPAPDADQVREAFARQLFGVDA